MFRFIMLLQDMLVSWTPERAAAAPYWMVSPVNLEESESDAMTSKRAFKHVLGLAVNVAVYESGLNVSLGPDCTLESVLKDAEKTRTALPRFTTYLSLNLKIHVCVECWQEV